MKRTLIVTDITPDPEPQPLYGSSEIANQCREVIAILPDGRARILKGRKDCLQTLIATLCSANDYRSDLAQSCDPSDDAKAIETGKKIVSFMLGALLATLLAGLIT